MAGINWKKLLDLNLDQIYDLRLAGYAYIRQGKYDVALPFFEALHAINSNSSYDLQTLGAIYVQIGDTKNAIYYLNEALKLKPDHAPTQLNLTKALLMAGKVKEGIKIARVLKRNRDPYIVSFAEALLLAYG